MEKIFVQIASFCDLYLVRTVNIALKRASHPERITFGICCQEKPKRFKKLLKKLPSSCSVVFHDYRESKGVGWARKQAQDLFKGEDFTLQVDAHMDFTPGWDVSLIDMWKKCENNKAIISQVCDDWQHLPQRQLKFQPRYTLGISTEWYKDCFGVHWGQKIIGNVPVLQAFTCAHMVFAPNPFFIEIPIDPQIGYAYEENSLDLRAYTNGWDVYAPNLNVVRHSYRKNSFLDMDLGIFWEQAEVSRHRMRRLIGLDPEPITGSYGLGVERTMKQWANFSGVNFKTKEVTKEARLGIVNTSSHF